MRWGRLRDIVVPILDAPLPTSATEDLNHIHHSIISNFYHNIREIGTMLRVGLSDAQQRSQC